MSRRKQFFSEAERAQAKKEANLRWWHRHKLGITGGAKRRNPDLSPDVIDERNRAFAGTRDLTATLLGDPLPSRSALAQKQNANPVP